MHILDKYETKNWLLVGYLSDIDNELQHLVYGTHLVFFPTVAIGWPAVCNQFLCTDNTGNRLCATTSAFIWSLFPFRQAISSIPLLSVSPSPFPPLCCFPSICLLWIGRERKTEAKKDKYVFPRPFVREKGWEKEWGEKKEKMWNFIRVIACYWPWSVTGRKSRWGKQ